MRHYQLHHSLRLFILSALLLLLIDAQSHAQQYYWKVIAAFENTDLMDIDCADSTDCMMAAIVGAGLMNSIVYHSDDGGHSWLKRFDDTLILQPAIDRPLKLFTIQHPTRELTLVGADSGIILRSSDAGASWQRMQVVGPQFTCERLSMYDENHGIAAFFGVGTPIMVTSDGGLHWKQIALPWPDEPAWDTLAEYATYMVECIAPSTYLCVMRGPRTHTLFRSSDGGETWSYLPSLFGPDYDTIRLSHTAFSFIDTATGFVSSTISLAARQPGVPIHSVIARTNDGGRSWQVIFRDTLGKGTQGEAPIKFAFRDTLEGVVSGFYKLYSTSSGGRSWHIDSAETDRLIYATPIFKEGLPELFMAHPTALILRRTPLVSSVEREQHTSIGESDWQIENVIFDGNTLLVQQRMPKSMQIRMGLYDLMGEERAAAISEDLPPGKHRLRLDLTGLPSGYYMLRLDSGGEQRTLSIMLAR